MTITAERRPRYRVLADELRRQVLGNAFAAPDQFPTEAELCQTYGVSRFTVREALRALQAEGLIRRRRGSGTTVQPASARGGALHQPLSNVGEILQYAHDTRIVFERLPAAALPKALAEEIGAAASAGLWSRFTGVRTGGAADSRPIALTEAYLHPDLADVAARIDIAGATLFRQMEALGGCKIDKVTQDIQAVPAGGEVARKLGVARRSPALRILRCYYDANGRLLEISASHHPGDRFAYSMHIEADGG